MKLKTEHKMLVTALICGAAAAVLAYFVIDMKEREVMESMQPVKIIFASDYIPRGGVISASLLKYGKMPRRFVTKAHVKDYEKVRGKIAIAPFIKGEPLLANKLVEKGGDIETSIPTGLRAVSVSVDEASGVGYMIKPGSYVDVLLTYAEAKKGKMKTITSTILQSALVVAVGSDVSAAETGRPYKSITLALTPDEAELLAFSRRRGDITFALRALGDRNRAKLRDVDFDILSEDQEKYNAGAGKKEEYISGPEKREIY